MQENHYCWITGTLSLVQQYRLAEKHGLNYPLGLDQRASIIIGWVWLALTALRLLR